MVKHKSSVFKVWTKSNFFVSVDFGLCTLSSCKHLEDVVVSSDWSPWKVLLLLKLSWASSVGGGTDKSLARPGRKQTTATKLGIYSIFVSMLLKSRASPDMLHFSLCNKKSLAIRHMNRPFFPTTLSIPSYDFLRSWNRESLSSNSPTLAVAASRLVTYAMLCVKFLSSWWWPEKPP